MNNAYNAVSNRLRRQLQGAEEAARVFLDMLDTLTRERDTLLAQVEGVTRERDGAVAKAAAEHRQLVDVRVQRDQLRARGAELEQLVSLAFSPTVGNWGLKADELLNRTPAQSVAHIEAAALEKLGAELVTLGYTSSKVFIELYVTNLLHRAAES